MARIIVFLSAFCLLLFAGFEIARTTDVTIAGQQLNAGGLERKETLAKDFSLWQERTKPYAGSKLTPAWRDLLAASRDAGWSGSLNGMRSGVRSRADQRLLWKRYLNGTGAPAFPPGGRSRHLLENVRARGQWSQAVDVSRPGELLRAASSLGVTLVQPYANEPWHIEAKGPFALAKNTFYLPGEAGGKPASLWLFASLLFILVLRLLGKPQWRTLLLFACLGLLSILFSKPSLAFVLFFTLLVLTPFLVHSRVTQKILAGVFQVRQRV